MDPDPFAGPPGISNDDDLEATAQCGGEVVDFTATGSAEVTLRLCPTIGRLM